MCKGGGVFACVFGRGDSNSCQSLSTKYPPEKREMAGLIYKSILADDPPLYLDLSWESEPGRVEGLSITVWGN